MSGHAYALRDRKTGLWFPQGRGRGFTHDDATTDSLPRLFGRRQDAEIALRWWRKGKTSASRGKSYDGEYWEDITTTAVPSRGARDIEVVRVAIVPCEESAP